jgi:hypothetical protein
MISFLEEALLGAMKTNTLENRSIFFCAVSLFPDEEKC